MSDISVITYNLEGCERPIFSSTSMYDCSKIDDPHGFIYIDGALVPNVDSEDEHSSSELFNCETFRSGIDILVGSYTELTDDEKQYLLELSETLTPEHSINSDVRLLNIKQKFSLFLQKISKQNSPAEDIRFLFYPPNLPTTTGNYNTLTLLGMHLDDIDKRYPDARKLRRQRLLFNLSSEPRIFFYGDLPYENFEYLDKNLVAQHMASESFEIGVTKYFHLAPFEFCIVPTETLFHDGSTAFCENPVLTLTGLLEPEFTQIAKLVKNGTI